MKAYRDETNLPRRAAAEPKVAGAASFPAPKGTSPHPPEEERAERRIEVHVTHDDDGRRRVILQDLSWGSGLGWYVQKTIRLDAQQVEAIMGALCCAKQLMGKVGGHTASPGKEASPSPVDPKILNIEDLLSR